MAFFDNFYYLIATLVQRLRYFRKIKKIKFTTKTNRLKYIYTKFKKRPQVKGIVIKLVTMSPKKPNSANRFVAKINLSNLKKITARLPGKGYLCSKYNRVLANGGRANDLPGVSYSLIRGVYDFPALFTKRKRRSIYGVARSDNQIKYIRKKNRKLGF